MYKHVFVGVERVSALGGVLRFHVGLLQMHICFSHLTDMCMQRSCFCQAGVASVKRFAIEDFNMFCLFSLVQACKAFHTDDDS